VLLTFLAVMLPGGFSAADDGAGKNPYGDRSDDELTALAASWDSLDKLQRRALLTEMKLRMARRGASDENAVIHIRTERRYGRIIRQADGRVIRIETQVVHVRPLDDDERQVRQGFGVGFERRVARREQDRGVAGEQVMGQQRPDGDQQDSLRSILKSLEAETVAPQLDVPLYRVADPAP
jgi:hypothetical protein